MLGWHISVYREAPTDQNRIAVWQTGLAGLDWIDALIASGSGRQTSAGGYPNRYTLAARDVVPVLLQGPPEARERWITEPGAVQNDKWIGRTLIDREAAATCPPDELLLIVAWDES